MTGTGSDRATAMARSRSPGAEQLQLNIDSTLSSFGFGAMYAVGRAASLCAAGGFAAGLLHTILSSAQMLRRAIRSGSRRASIARQGIYHRAPLHPSRHHAWNRKSLLGCCKPGFHSDDGGYAAFRLVLPSDAPPSTGGRSASPLAPIVHRVPGMAPTPNAPPTAATPGPAATGRARTSTDPSAPSPRPSPAPSARHGPASPPPGRTPGAR